MPNAALDQWLETPAGQYLLAWERPHFERLVTDVFGFNAVQIGLAGHDLLHANRMPLRLHAALEGAELALLPEELPFASQSLDLLVLPHVLEFATQPQQVLREVERVLLPEGHLLISGFAPYSLWGLRRALAGHIGGSPWCGEYLSAARLRDWLGVLGFELRATVRGCHVPPLASQRWLERLSFCESVGRLCWPFAGGAYILHAVKRVQGMRVITPGWRQAGARRRALLPVAHRDGRQSPLFRRPNH